MYKYYLIFFLAFTSSEIKSESLNYEFSNWSGKPLSVYVTKPKRINSQTRLVVVMHGRKRNAEEYRDQWIETSNELNLLVVVPEFSNKDFPEVWGFNYGNVKTKTLVPVQSFFYLFEKNSEWFQPHLRKQQDLLGAALTLWRYSLPTC